MTIHRFLSVTAPVPAKILVIEAWIWAKPAAMREVSEEVKRGYQYVVCVGKASQTGLAGDLSAAALARTRLIALGVAPDRIRCLSIQEDGRDRTYRCALAVRDWGQQEVPEAKALNVFTVGIHARKSRLLFQKAFGPDYQIGIIAGTETEYPVDTWWLSRKGVYLVLRNTAGYLHALLPMRNALECGDMSPLVFNPGRQVSPNQAMGLKKMLPNGANR